MSFSSWWRQKSAEFHYSRKLRKMRAAANRQQRLDQAQKKKWLKAQGQASGLTWGQKFQKFKLERERKKRLKAAWWSEVGSHHPVYKWFHGKRSLLPWALFLGLGAVFVVLLVKSPRVTRGGVTVPDPRSVSVLTVNGKKISQADLREALELTYGPVVLQQLLEQEVIRQEAERRKVSLTKEEEAGVSSALFTNPLRKVRQPQLESQILLGKIVLKDVTDERRKEVFRDFSEDLWMYQIDRFPFKDRTTAAEFERQVSNGVPYEEAAAKLCSDSWKTVGNLSISQIYLRFGPAAAERVKGSQAGQRLGPVDTPEGLSIFWVRKVGKKFDEVKPAIDALIVDAEASQTMHQLISKAKLESPFLTKTKKPKSATTPVAKPK